jgi:hypothetical protein
MSLKIGQYIHAEYKNKVDDSGVPKRVAGQITGFAENGDILLSGGLNINPDEVDIFIFNDVTSLTPADKIARAEAMLRHPAGKGRRHL